MRRSPVLDTGLLGAKAQVTLEALSEQNPDAFEALVDWIRLPAHNKTITLVFHGGKFQKTKFETSAGGNGS